MCNQQILFKNEKNQTKLADCFDYISNYSNKCNLTEVKPYLFKAKYPLAKAKALLESAIILNSKEENFQAVQRLDVCLNTPKNYFTQTCRYNKEDILRPVFYLTKNLPQDIAPKKEYNLSYKVANIDKINGYIYKLSAEN